MTRDSRVERDAGVTRESRRVDVDVDIERVYVPENLNLYALCNLCETL